MYLSQINYQSMPIRSVNFQSNGVTKKALSDEAYAALQRRKPELREALNEVMKNGGNINDYLASKLSPEEINIFLSEEVIDLLKGIKDFFDKSGRTEDPGFPEQLTGIRRSYGLY